MALLGRVRYPSPYRELARRGPLPVERLAMGPDADQRVELRRPSGGGARGVVVLVHGGFWRDVWRLDLMNALAVDLAGRGLAAWNVEYRRVGRRGDAWPAALDDVLLAGRALAASDLGTLPVVTVGHSAGGQLALWLAGALAAEGRSPAGAVSLAGVTDLRSAARLHLGDDAAQDLCGGEPEEVPDRYALASPAERLPLGVPQLYVHGELDEAVPVAMSRAVAGAALAAGDAAELLELPGVAHSALVDPAQPYWEPIRSWIDARLRAAG